MERTKTHQSMIQIISLKINIQIAAFIVGIIDTGFTVDDIEFDYVFCSYN